MDSDSVIAICITLLIILCLGTPDLLDALVKCLMN
jgi:hypothetical protein